MLFPQRRKFRVTRKLNVCSSHDNRLTLIFPTLDGYVCNVYLSRGVRRRDNLMMHYECFLSPAFFRLLEEVYKRSGGTLPEPSFTISKRRLVQRISHCCSISAASVGQ